MVGIAIGSKNRFTVYILIAGTAAVALALFLALGMDSSTARDQNGPLLHDSELVAELVADGLRYPTSMRFLDDGSILVLQKNDGWVRLISDGKLLHEPVLQVDVAD